MYMSSVLGSGVLVLPGLAANIAGPGSLIAWVALSLASYPLAYTFASLSARKAESGGVYSFARESFGPRAANAVGWLFVTWYVTGAPAVTVIAASYLSYAFPLGRPLVYLAAGLLILGAFLINYHGIIISGKVQLAVIAAIVILLVTTVITSVRLINLSNFTPFLPYGLVPVGVAGALIFWSYLGYENVSNVAEEFKNPEKDFHRSILLSVIVISILYLSISITTVGTKAYQAGGSVAPFAAMLSNAVGLYAVIATAILAVFIIFGTVNAYTTGMSRVVYATAKHGGLPRQFDKIHEATGVPHRSLMLLSGLSTISLTVYFFLNLDLTTVLLIPSGAAILVYVIGSASGIKLLKRRRVYPWISLVISLIMLPFVGILLVASLVPAVLGFLYNPKIESAAVTVSGERSVVRN
jgi:amino acid efflux transporter